MIVSEARIAANRRNAQKSTGPKTEEGKSRSRFNAVKHGLCASEYVPEDAQFVGERTTSFFQSLQPRDHNQAWFVSEIALFSIRIEHCERVERRHRLKATLRAELFWDDDRRLEAELLGERLAERPAVVLEQLRRTPHGCEWLMARWAMLAHVADGAQPWTADQERLAFDLLGTPAEFRPGLKPGASLDFDGRVVGPAGDQAALARREIDALKQRRELVGEMDEVERSLAAADVSDTTDLELRRLRRYESALYARLRWCHAQLKNPTPETQSPRGLYAAWVLEKGRPAEAAPPAVPDITARAPEPEPEPGPNPPFDLELHELPPLGQPLNIPMIRANRRQRSREKAQARVASRRQAIKDLRS